ncbi:hypothetical protein E4T66_17910 [Sinimarinibacterium sp. CAU 1509]|uniref:hypothetical protein n=1 Tax=Sinimarinibacterium sp. CAU 1509 TaxID=2562283 RepID=UPI0010ABFDA8|nr:hypothetical protein [Sinimarinibacterium sp. CAU 1509]TJY57281.1 hypothetical protein E4T66_17910 [Sinimarinibacterium sp. CAU 1509]
MIGQVLTHKGVTLSALAAGDRVSYTLASGGRTLGQFVRFIPENIQAFELQKLSWLYGDFFGV